MKTSEKGLNLIKQFEGYVPSAYKCPAGVWTIGWGHTKGVKEGDRIDSAQAEVLLASDILDFEQAVNAAGFPDLTQNQFDAIVSLAFNIGTSNFSPSKSTLYRLLADGCRNKELIERWWRCWKNAAGVEQQGLVKRREAELRLFFDNAAPFVPKSCKNPSGCRYADNCR